MALWNLEEAVELVRRIEPSLRAEGYFTALTGGNLHRGYSEKDCDIYVMSINDNKSYSRETVTRVLTGCGLKLIFPLEKMNVYPGRNRNDVEIWSFNDKRVDIFFIGLDIMRCLVHDECIRSQMIGEACYKERQKAAWKNPELNSYDGVRPVAPAPAIWQLEWNEY